MNDINRTMFAQAGSDLASQFDHASEDLSWGRLRLAGLDVSTDGGKLARQSMMIEPRAGGSAAVIGWVNVAERRGEVRDHRLVAEAFEARYNQKFFLTKPQYEDALALVDFLLKRQNVEYTRVVPSAVPGAGSAGGRAEPAPPASGGSGLTWVLVSVLVLAGLGAAYYYYYFMR